MLGRTASLSRQSLAGPRPESVHDVTAAGDPAASPPCVTPHTRILTAGFSPLDDDFDLQDALGGGGLREYCSPTSRVAGLLPVAPL